MQRKSLFGLFLLGFIVLGLIVPMVSAERAGDALVNSFLRLFGFDSDSTAGIGLIPGLSNTTLAQILMFMLVALIIYGISPFLPFVGEKPWVSGTISIIVALLATLFLKTEEINTILLSYGALGIVLTGIIPFFAIAAIAKRSHESQHPLLAKVIWLAFIIVTFYRWYVADVAEIGTFGKYVFPLILIISIIMFLWEKRIYLLMFKQKIRDYAGSFREDQIAEGTAELERMNAEIMATTNPAVQARLIEKYNKKAAKLRSLGIKWFDWGKG